MKAPRSATLPRSMHTVELLNSLYCVGESYHAMDRTPGRDHIEGTIHKGTAEALLASDPGGTGVNESYGRMDLEHVLSCQDWPLHSSKRLDGFQEPVLVMPLKAKAAGTMEGVELSQIALRPARFDFVGPPRRGFIVVCAEALSVKDLVLVNKVIRATPLVEKISTQHVSRDVEKTRMSAQDEADAAEIPPLQYGRFMIEITALQEPPQEQLHFLVDDPIVALDRPAIFNPGDAAVTPNFVYVCVEEVYHYNWDAQCSCYRADHFPVNNDALIHYKGELVQMRSVYERWEESNGEKLQLFVSVAFIGLLGLDSRGTGGGAVADDTTSGAERWSEIEDTPQRPQRLGAPAMQRLKYGTKWWEAKRLVAASAGRPKGKVETLNAASLSHVGHRPVILLVAPNEEHAPQLSACVDALNGDARIGKVCRDAGVAMLSAGADALASEAVGPFIFYAQAYVELEMAPVHVWLNYEGKVWRLRDVPVAARDLPKKLAEFLSLWRLRVLRHWTREDQDGCWGDAFRLHANMILDTQLERALRGGAPLDLLALTRHVDFKIESRLRQLFRAALWEEIELDAELNALAYSLSIFQIEDENDLILHGLLIGDGRDVARNREMADAAVRLVIAHFDKKYAHDRILGLEQMLACFGVCAIETRMGQDDASASSSHSSAALNLKPLTQSLNHVSEQLDDIYDMAEDERKLSGVASSSASSFTASWRSANGDIRLELAEAHQPGRTVMHYICSGVGLLPKTFDLVLSRIVEAIEIVVANVTRTSTASYSSISGTMDEVSNQTIFDQAVQQMLGVDNLDRTPLDYLCESADEQRLTSYFNSIDRVWLRICEKKVLCYLPSWERDALGQVQWAAFDSTSAVGRSMMVVNARVIAVHTPERMVELLDIARDAECVWFAIVVVSASAKVEDKCERRTDGTRAKWLNLPSKDVARREVEQLKAYEKVLFEADAYSASAYARSEDGQCHCPTIVVRADTSGSAEEDDGAYERHRSTALEADVSVEVIERLKTAICATDDLHQKLAAVGKMEYWTRFDLEPENETALAHFRESFNAKMSSLFLGEEMQGDTALHLLFRNTNVTSTLALRYLALLKRFVFEGASSAVLSVHANGTATRMHRKRAFTSNKVAGTSLSGHRSRMVENIVGCRDELRIGLTDESIVSWTLWNRCVQPCIAWEQYLQMWSANHYGSSPLHELAETIARGARVFYEGQESPAAQKNCENHLFCLEAFLNELVVLDETRAKATMDVESGAAFAHESESVDDAGATGAMSARRVCDHFGRTPLHRLCEAYSDGWPCPGQHLEEDNPPMTFPTAKTFEKLRRDEYWQACITSKELHPLIYDGSGADIADPPRWDLPRYITEYINKLVSIGVEAKDQKALRLERVLEEVRLQMDTTDEDGVNKWNTLMKTKQEEIRNYLQLVESLVDRSGQTLAIVVCALIAAEWDDMRALQTLAGVSRSPLRASAASCSGTSTPRSSSSLGDDRGALDARAKSARAALTDIIMHLCPTDTKQVETKRLTRFGNRVFHVMLVVLSGTGVGEVGSTTAFTGTSVDAFYDAIAQQETDTGLTALAYLCGASGEKPSLPNSAVLKQYFEAEKSPEPLLESLGLNIADSLATDMAEDEKVCPFTSGSALIPENTRQITPLHFLMQRIFKLVLRRPFNATMRRCEAILNEFGSVVDAADCFKEDAWGRVPLDLLLGDKMQISALTQKEGENQIEILKKIVHSFLLDEERLEMLEQKCGDRTKDKISLLDPPNCWRLKDAVTQTKRDPGPQGKYKKKEDPAFARLNFSMQFSDRANPPDPRICYIELVRYNPPFVDASKVEHAESETRFFMKYESEETMDVPRPWRPMKRLHTLREVEKDEAFFDDPSAFGRQWEETDFDELPFDKAKAQALYGDRRTEPELAFRFAELPMGHSGLWRVPGSDDQGCDDVETLKYGWKKALEMMASWDEYQEDEYESRLSTKNSFRDARFIGGTERKDREVRIPTGVQTDVWVGRNHGNILHLACSNIDTVLSVDFVTTILNKCKPAEVAEAIDMQNEDGMTPLHCVLSVECVTTSEYASCADQYDIKSDYIGLRGRRSYSVDLGASIVIVQIVRLLACEHNAQAHLIDKAGYTPLHLACKCHYPEAVEAMLKESATARLTVNWRSNNEAASSPMHLAAQAMNVECVTLLLEYGADPDPVDTFGATPNAYILADYSAALSVLYAEIADEMQNTVTQLKNFVDSLDRKKIQMSANELFASSRAFQNLENVQAFYMKCYVISSYLEHMRSDAVEVSKARRILSKTEDVGVLIRGGEKGEEEGAKRRQAHVEVEKRLEINAARAFRTFIAAIRRLQQTFRSWRARRRNMNNRRINRRAWKQRDNHDGLILLSERLGRDQNDEMYIEEHSEIDVNFLSYPVDAIGKKLRKEHRRSKKERWEDGVALSWKPGDLPVAATHFAASAVDGSAVEMMDVVHSTPILQYQFDDVVATKMDSNAKHIICMGRLHSAKEVVSPITLTGTFPFLKITPLWFSTATDWTCNALSWFLVRRWSGRAKRWKPNSVLMSTSDVDVVKVTPRGIYKNEDAHKSDCTKSYAEWVPMCTMAEILGVRQRFSATADEFFFELELTGGRTRILCYKPWRGGGQLPEGHPEPVGDFMKHGPLMTRVKTQNEVTTSGSVVRTRSIERAWLRDFQTIREVHKTVVGPDGVAVKVVEEPRLACEPKAVHDVGMAWVDAFEFAIQSTKREEAPLIDLRSRIADQLFEKAKDSQASFDSVAENSSFFTRTDDTAVFPSQASMIIQYFRMKQADLKKLEDSLNENAHQHQLFKDPRIQFSMKSEYEGGAMLCPCRSAECHGVERMSNCDAGTCESWACDDPCPCNPHCQGVFTQCGCETCCDLRKCGVCSVLDKCGPARMNSYIGFLANLFMVIITFFSLMQMNGYISIQKGRYEILTGSTVFDYHQRIAKGWLNPVSELDGGQDEAMGNLDGFQKDFWGWVQGDLGNALFPEAENYRGTKGGADPNTQSLVAIEGFNKYIGRPRLRQLRTQSLKCGHSADDRDTRMHQWSQSEQDQETLFPEGCFETPIYPSIFGWQDQQFMTAAILPVEGSTHPNQTLGFTWSDDGLWSSRPGSLAMWHNLFTYPSSGYTLNIPGDAAKGTDLIEGLKSGGWLDLNTRAIFLEFVLYNVNLDMYTVGRATMEFPPSGAMKTSSSTSTLKLRQSYSGVEGIFWLIVHSMMFGGFALEAIHYIDYLAKKLREPESTLRGVVGAITLIDLVNIIMMIISAVSIYLHVHGVAMEYSVNWNEKENFPADVFWLGTIVQHKNRLLGLIAGWRMIMLLPHLALIDSKTNEMYRICNGMITKMSSFIVILLILMLGMAITWHLTIGVEDATSPTFMMGILNQYAMLLGGIATDLPLEIYSGAVSTSVLVYSNMLLLVIGFVMNILMLNLVIAVMSEAYEDIKETSQAMWCLEQFQLLNATQSRRAARDEKELAHSKAYWDRVLTKSTPTNHHRGRGARRIAPERRE